MITYFLRRMLGAMALLWLAMLIPFTILIEGPWGPGQGPFRGCCDFPSSPQTEFRSNLAYVDKPWPLNYLDWWYDPQAPHIPSHRKSDPYLPLHWREYISPAGVLTGHLGYSVPIGEDEAVVNVLGEGWWLPSAAMLGATLALMSIAALQRSRRPIPLRTTVAPPETIRDNSYLLRLRNGV